WRYGALEQRDVHVERAEPETAGGRGDCRRWSAGYGVCVQRPQEDADVWDVVAATVGGDSTNVDLVSGAVETGIHVQACAPVAKVGRVVVPQAGMIHRLGWGQQLKNLDGVCPPSGHIARKLLHDQDRPLAAPK